MEIPEFVGNLEKKPNKVQDFVADKLLVNSDTMKLCLYRKSIQFSYGESDTLSALKERNINC